jgi:hypothetical protein
LTDGVADHAVPYRIGAGFGFNVAVIAGFLCLLGTVAAVGGLTGHFLAGLITDGAGLEPVGANLQLLIAIITGLIPFIDHRISTKEGRPLDPLTTWVTDLARLLPIDAGF